MTTTTFESGVPCKSKRKKQAQKNRISKSAIHSDGVQIFKHCQNHTENRKCEVLLTLKVSDKCICKAKNPGALKADWRLATKTGGRKNKSQNWMATASSTKAAPGTPQKKQH